MTPVEFVRLTSRETGGELFLRRDMIAAVCSGYKGVTHVTLINEDIDFEVKESVMETLRLITGETYGIQNTKGKSVGTGGNRTMSPVQAGRQGQRGVDRRNAYARIRRANDLCSEGRPTSVDIISDGEP